MQMEIIDIDSSESDGDTNFESTKTLYGSSTVRTTGPSGNAPRRFRDQNHDMEIHTQRLMGSSNGSKMLASHVSSGRIPMAVMSDDGQDNIIENDGADGFNMSNELDKSFGSYERATHGPQPQKYSEMMSQLNPENGFVISDLGADNNSSQTSKHSLPSSFLSVPSIKSNGRATHGPQPRKYSEMMSQLNPENCLVISDLGADTNSSQTSKRTLPSSFLSVPSLKSYGRATYGPQPQEYSEMMSQLNPENGLVISDLGTDTNSSQTSKRTLPSPFISVPNLKSHGMANLKKAYMLSEKNKGSGESADGLADPASRPDAKSKQHTEKEGHLSYDQPRNPLDFVDEQLTSKFSKLQGTSRVSGAANACGPNVHVEEVGKMTDENDILEKDHRTLPPWWTDAVASNKHSNASVVNGGNNQNTNFGTKPSFTLTSNKSGNAHKLLDSSIRNEKRSTLLEGLYEGRDDVYIYENTSTPRVLPSSFLHGKFTSNTRPAGFSDRRNFPGIVERRPEHDEMPIYQEALQNLGQPKMEDDLPEGLLSVTLLKHQKIALAWTVQKEKSVHCAGGILADDQGLGKTISMIALILKQMDLQLKFTSDDSHHVKPEALNLDDDEANDDSDAKCIEKQYLKTKQMASNSENSKPAAGTLVVCPASVLRQWSRELDEKVSSSAKLSVLVYHGGTRTKDPRYVAKHDVVLTTYSIITNEVPKQPLVDDDDDDDDDNDQRNMDKYGLSSESRASKKRKQTSNANRNRKKKGKGLKESQFDYDSGPIARVRWFRVILDEAQTIKNHRTKVARACCGLRAKRRWCLSGTPMQNSIDDLYSYFKFLKYDPYAVYSSFCNSIKYPISRNASHGYKKLQAVLRIVLLRRTKGTLINGVPIIKLPPRSISLMNIDFSSEERAFYLKLEAHSQQQFKAYAAAGTVKQNYANILLMLLRLRQACDHPVLVKGYYSEAIARDSLEMARLLPREMLMNLFNQLEASLAICAICNDPPEDAVVTMCGHVFCYQCVSDCITGDDNLCPAMGCKEVLGTDSVFSKATLRSCISDESNNTASSSSSFHVEESSIVLSSYVSSKIRAVVEILNSLESYHASEAKNYGGDYSDKPTKAIVFSQWTGMLDLLEISLNHSVIQYRRLDGTMTLSSRDRAVREFNTDPEVTVMLMSLKAGNLGLNMVAACHVIILDLWWNPTTEDQAIDRAHRIGQTRPVIVSRLTIKDTVEDRILALQEEKRKMVSSAFGEDQTGTHATRLTVEDLRYLFMA